MVIIQIFLIFLTVYFTVGVIFALFYITMGAPKIDNAIKTSKWTVKLLLFPGTVMSWPFLMYNYFLKRADN